MKKLFLILFLSTLMQAFATTPLPPDGPNTPQLPPDNQDDFYCTNIDSVTSTISYRERSLKFKCLTSSNPTSSTPSPIQLKEFVAASEGDLIRAFGSSSMSETYLMWKHQLESARINNLLSVINSYITIKSSSRTEAKRAILKVHTQPSIISGRPVVVELSIFSNY